MSMEDAILAHANALLTLAEALNNATAYRADLARQSIGDDAAGNAEAAEAADDSVLDSAAREAIRESLDRARTERKTKDAELDKAVSKVEDDAKNEGGDAEASGATSPENGAGSVDVGDAEAAPLDYAKDVKPLLLAAIKKGKRPDIEAHLAQQGVKRADELSAEKLPELFALAQKLAA